MVKPASSCASDGFELSCAPMHGCKRVGTIGQEGRTIGGVMKKTVAGAVLVIVAIGGYAAVVSAQPKGVTRTELGRGTVSERYRFESEAGTDVVVQQVTIEPGGTTGWHTHPGP